MASPTQESEPHAFVKEELSRALNEQSFGITSYEIVSSTPLKAAASVVLLESDTILVSLSSRGFQLHSLNESPTDPDLDAELVFETLEQLLQSVSLQYDAARRSALIAKLDALASLQPA
ncbi:hypothetical protein LXA43DRAFT_882761 [Ganoderma leucocontextum]|nr:hypothetical protein LXA43DRAFT_882761 [Ganoderma leucocontextum]